MSESNLKSNSKPSQSSTRGELESVEEEGEDLECEKNVHSFPLPVQLFPWDLSTKRGRCSKSSSSAISTDPFNFMLSDSNPLYSQLYLKYSNYQGKLGRLKSSLENPKTGEDPKSEKGERQGYKNMLDKRSRDAEKYRLFQLGLTEVQMRAQNISLQTKLKNLEDEKSRLMQLQKFWKY